MLGVAIEEALGLLANTEHFTISNKLVDLAKLKVLAVLLTLHYVYEGLYVRIHL